VILAGSALDLALQRQTKPAKLLGYSDRTEEQTAVRGHLNSTAPNGLNLSQVVIAIATRAQLLVLKHIFLLLCDAGGKWTTYRRMAEDAVDAALATGRVQVAHQCTTSRLKLLGGQAYKHTQHAEVGVVLKGSSHLFS
jgi:hypothetical protein